MGKGGCAAAQQLFVSPEFGARVKGAEFGEATWSPDMEGLVCHPRGFGLHSLDSETQTPP